GQLRDGDRGQRRAFGRLPQDGITADGGDGGVPGPHRHGEVEGGDDSDRAQRMPLLVHPVIGSLGCDDLPVELAGEADGEVADVDHLLHLADALGADLPHLETHEGAEDFALVTQSVAEPTDVVAANGGGNGPPPLERLDGRSHRRLIVVGSAQAHRGQGLTGRWIGNVDRPSRTGSPLAGDADPADRLPFGETEGVEDFLLVHLLPSRMAATTSISTRKPPGSAPAWMAERAGGCSPK